MLVRSLWSSGVENAHPAIQLGTEDQYGLKHKPRGSLSLPKMDARRAETCASWTALNLLLHSSIG
jgi:hypothetical protein